MKIGRRGFFGLLTGLLGSRWMPAPRLRFPLRYASVPISFDAVNRVTQSVMLPAIQEHLQGEHTLLALLERDMEQATDVMRRELDARIFNG